MMNRIRNISSASASENGASAVEYGLLIAAIAAIVVGIVFGLGTIVKRSFAKTCSAVGISDASAATECAK